MPPFPKRKPSVYEDERQRLLQHMTTLHPHSDEYEKTLAALDRLDKINNRSTELTKVAIPALSTVASVAGIYALQQFAGVIVPKALETLASRSSHKFTE